MADSETRFAFRLDKDFHKDLKRKALEEEVSLAEVARTLLRMWLEGTVEIPIESHEGVEVSETE